MASASDRALTPPIGVKKNKAIALLSEILHNSLSAVHPAGLKNFEGNTGDGEKLLLEF
ncbi:MAG: hypothetical protein AAGE92_08725 [Cyanobacteria bacterium P01_G01_bin.4]